MIVTVAYGLILLIYLQTSESMVLLLMDMKELEHIVLHLDLHLKLLSLLLSIQKYMAMYSLRLQHQQGLSAQIL